MHTNLVKRNPTTKKSYTRFYKKILKEFFRDINSKEPREGTRKSGKVHRRKQMMKRKYKRRVKRREDKTGTVFESSLEI